jgi:hypothetical protein
MCWALLGLPLAALVVGAEYGLGYVAYLTPTPVGSFAVGAVGCFIVIGLLGLVASGYRDMGMPEMLVAILVVVTTTVCGLAIGEQMLHERGRVEQAVVTSVTYSSDPEGDGGEVGTVEDLSGHPIPGTISADGLRVGERVTVTVDPEGRRGPERGSAVSSPLWRWFWYLALLLAALQAGLIAAIMVLVGRSNDAPTIPAPVRRAVRAVLMPRRASPPQ